MCSRPMRKRIIVLSWALVGPRSFIKNETECSHPAMVCLVYGFYLGFVFYYVFSVNIILILATGFGRALPQKYVGFIKTRKKAMPLNDRIHIKDTVRRLSQIICVFRQFKSSRGYDFSILVQCNSLIESENGEQIRM